MRATAKKKKKNLNLIYNVIVAHKVYIASFAETAHDLESKEFQGGIFTLFFFSINIWLREDLRNQECQGLYVCARGCVVCVDIWVRALFCGTLLVLTSCVYKGFRKFATVFGSLFATAALSLV